MKKWEPHSRIPAALGTILIATLAEASVSFAYFGQSNESISLANFVLLGSVWCGLAVASWLAVEDSVIFREGQAYRRESLRELPLCAVHSIRTVALVSIARAASGPNGDQRWTEYGAVFTLEAGELIGVFRLGTNRATATANAQSLAGTLGVELELTDVPQNAEAVPSETMIDQLRSGAPIILLILVVLVTKLSFFS